MHREIQRLYILSLTVVNTLSVRAQLKLFYLVTFFFVLVVSLRISLIFGDRMPAFDAVAHLKIPGILLFLLFPEKSYAMQLRFRHIYRFKVPFHFVVRFVDCLCGLFWVGLITCGFQRWAG